MKITYAPRALRDFRGIADYLAERNAAAARRVLATIKSSIDVLQHFPEIVLLVDDAGHRKLPVVRYSYIVVYRVTANEVIVLHIRHTARKPIDPATDL